MATTTTQNIIEVSKGGDWVKPIVLKDGSTVYALQINKSKDDKANIQNILADYASANIQVYKYTGKNDLDVLLVDATQKIRATRTSASNEKLVASAVEMFGVTEEMARAMIANAKK